MKKFALCFLSVCIISQSFIGCATIADSSVNKDVEGLREKQSSESYRPKREAESGIDLQTCFLVVELQEVYEKRLKSAGGMVRMSSIGAMGGAISGNLVAAGVALSIGPVYFGWQIVKTNSSKRKFLALHCDKIPLEELISAGYMVY
jgi:hypothetical protein